MSKKINTLWSAWTEESIELDFPDNWKIFEYSLPLDISMEENEVDLKIISALSNNIVSRKLAASRTVCILVDDINRPICWELILKCLIRGLNKKNIQNENIIILTSTAAHAQMNSNELKLKIGSRIMRQIRVIQHSPHSDFKWFEYKGKQVGINNLFCKADFKIAAGTLIPHPFAGFSGGGKAVMPGISDMDSIKRNHFLVSFGFGKVYDSKNSIRKQMDDIAELAGLDLIVNAVCNATRGVIKIFAGPLRETYDEGVTFAQNYTSMELKSDHNILILNAYPKDQELVQVSNAFNVFNTLSEVSKRAIKTIVIIARLNKKVGYHGIFGPGGSLYKAPSPLRNLKECNLIFYSPSLSSKDFHNVFAEEYRLVNDWKQIMELLVKKKLVSYDIGIFHQASMQVVKR
ncbi:MAG: lactate racemase domain-containing protein [Candidatus Neomarinimicrobiota bacterium]